MEKLPQQSFEQDLARQEARRSRRLEVVVEANLERIQAGHQAAAAAYRVEQLVTQREGAEGEIEAELEDLAPEVREPFSRAIRGYRFHEKKAVECENHLKDHAERMRQFGWEAGTSPDAWGDIFFREFVQDEPAGKVIFERREAYFVMICNDPGDYVRAVEGIRGGPESFDASHTAGVFHRAHLVNFKGGKKNYVPLMVVRGDEGVRRVVTHERQHFLNGNILIDFEATEELRARKERNPLVERLYRGIKDEMLAYLRDGSSGSDLRVALEKETYDHLFRPLPSVDEQVAHNVLLRMEQFLNRHHGSFDGDQARAILVYQLASVPLREFPKYLEALQIYYGERFRMLREFEEIDAAENREGLDLRRIAEEMFPPQCGAEADSVQFRLRAVVAKLDSLKEAASHLAYDPAIDLRSSRPFIRDAATHYRSLLSGAREVLRPLRRQGVVLPHATEALVRSGVRAVTPVQLERMDKVRRSVLERLADLPQDTLDEVGDCLKYYSARRPRVFTRLYQTIREAVQAEIEANTVRVDPYSVDPIRGVFGADVRVKKGREDAEFSLTIYSSRPGLL